VRQRSSVLGVVAVTMAVLVSGCVGHGSSQPTGTTSPLHEATSDASTPPPTTSVQVAVSDVRKALPTLREVPFGWTPANAPRYLMPFRMLVKDAACQRSLDTFDPLIGPAGAASSEIVKFSNLDPKFLALLVRVSVFRSAQAGAVAAAARQALACGDTPGARGGRAVRISELPGLASPGVGIRVVDHDVPPIRLRWTSAVEGLGNTQISVTEMGYGQPRDAEVEAVLKTVVAKVQRLAAG
jgi:hypothetical protein